MNILKAQHIVRYGFSLLSFLSACVCVQTAPQSRNISPSESPVSEAVRGVVWWEMLYLVRNIC